MRVRTLAAVALIAMAVLTGAPRAYALDHDLDSSAGSGSMLGSDARRVTDAPHGSRALGLTAIEAATETSSSAGFEAAADALPFTFVSLPFRVRRIPDALLPFNSSTAIPLVDPGVHDEQGVRMKLVDGVLHNHPSLQGHYGVENLNAYRLTGNTLYLDRAKAQAQRLIDRAVELDGTWIEPYDFEWDTFTAPWYSGLGQARALMLFSRLAAVTGDPVYREAADKVFASFLIEGPRDEPWFTNVDADGHLWFQEYPGAEPDYTYNGHTVAVFAMYDYYRLTGDDRAYQLFLGGATTTLETASKFRQPGTRSRYCLKHTFTASNAYHAIHTKFFLYLWTLIDEPMFPKWADTYLADFPPDRLAGWITVKPGFHDAVTPGGHLTHVRATRDMRVHVSFRRRLPGRSGYWFYATSGWNGYWIKEEAGRAYFGGQLVRVDYTPSRTLAVRRSGSYSLQRYDSSGHVLASRKLAYSRTATGVTLTRASARAVFRGQACALIASGPYAGYWIALGSRVTLR